jgi:hypothetical protein
LSTKYGDYQLEENVKMPIQFQQLLFKKENLMQFIKMEEL